MLAVVIAHSQIVMAERPKLRRRLPAGFDDADVAVLEWIAADGRRANREFAVMTSARHRCGWVPRQSYLAS
jgi:hypothetical protein